MSNNYPTGSGTPGGNSANNNRRERVPGANAPINTGTLPTINTGRSYSGGFDFEEMIFSLRELFAHDRQVASQADNKRCGICYLYFTANELFYREEEGFYVCFNCERAMGKQNLPMIRRQQK